MRGAWRTAAIAVFTLSILLGGVFGDRVLALTDEARSLLRVYTELVTLAHENYGGEIEYDDIVTSSINGMVRTLDPHTSFLSREAYSSMRERQKSTFHGLGILVGLRNGQLTVITPIEGTPASRMGLRAGDVISKIEGESTDSMNIDQAVSRLKGPRGTQVNVEIVRQGLDEPLEMTITRAEIPQDTVRYVYMITPETGYLTISDFNRGTGKEVAEAIADLKEQGMTRLLLDLRNNGGGLLDQAIEVADQFLPDGSKIVETRGRTRESFQEYYASGRHEKLDMPVVVLVNDGTASAAEILAGAIQDHDVGLVVGTPTWGKGLVQTVFSLSYQSGIALTTAKYFTPSGRLIQRDYSSWFDYATHSNGNDDGEPSEQAQVFRTDLGREVYGGGGITPDIESEGREISTLLQYLLSRSTFFDFANSYTSAHAIESPQWTPPENLMAEFQAWLLEEELATEEEIEGLSSADDAEIAQRYLHAEIFNSAFGIEARYQVLAAGDQQIVRALEAFKEAQELLAQRLELNNESQQAAVGS
jgi:carboxyl-terminal processing protease